MTLLSLAGNELAVSGRSTQLLLGDIEGAFWGSSFLKNLFALRNNFTSLILIDDRSALHSSSWSFQASSSYRIASSSVTFLTNCGAVDSESNLPLSNHVVSEALINNTYQSAREWTKIGRHFHSKHFAGVSIRHHQQMTSTLYATLYLPSMRSVLTIKMPKMIWFQVKPTL